MHVNYQYLLDRGGSLVPKEGRILDYGCGKGGTVEEGVKRNLDIFGVEAFSHGSGTTIKEELQDKNLLDQRVKELVGCHIPFPDHHFDLVISNQVFEHVVELDEVLKEIDRVLKPGGKVLCLFPSKEVIREGHCGILFAHWLPKSKMRYYWLLFCRSIGFGRLKRRRTNKQWARFFNTWLDEHVTYRTIRELHRNFGQNIGAIEHLEHDYVAFRLKSRNHHALSEILSKYPVKYLSSWLFRLSGGLNMLVSKKIK